jgi:dienelactone hydrolase
MEWYVATDEHGQPRSARAVVVVHESGSGMKVGRVFARGLRQHGLHTFMLHLPYYGERRGEGKRAKDSRLIPKMQQAIADVRRARDAVAVLPWVDTSHIALQGTSLGGFVSATAAGLDRGYDSVYLMLAGGRLYDVIQNGQRDAAKVREELAKAGLSGEKLKSLAWKIEPTRLAHRIDPQMTWLYSGVFDTVVPMSSAKALADAAGLDDQHHLQLLANHYTGVIYLPLVLKQIHENVNR